MYLCHICDEKYLFFIDCLINTIKYSLAVLDAGTFLLLNEFYKEQGKEIVRGLDTDNSDL